MLEIIEALGHKPEVRLSKSKDQMLLPIQLFSRPPRYAHQLRPTAGAVAVTG